MGWQYNAGRPGWREKVEDTLRVDIRLCERFGRQKPEQNYVLFWRSVNFDGVGSVQVSINRASLLATISLIAVRVGSEENIIKITHTSCNFGGRRMWFLCPRCDKRAAIIFTKDRVWACRTCLQLTYRSQCDGRISRLQKRQVKAETDLARISSRKGIHKKTRRRYWEKYVEADMAWEEGWLKQAAQFGARGRCKNLRFASLGA